MRLKQRAEFVAVAKGRRINMPALTLQAMARDKTGVKNDGNAETALNMPRFGLTVTNKTGNSPERNRMRRRLREMLRLSELPAQDKFDYVIIGRRAILSLPFAELKAELSRALMRIHAPRQQEQRGAGQRGSVPRVANTPSPSDQTG